MAKKTSKKSPIEKEQETSIPLQKSRRLWFSKTQTIFGIVLFFLMLSLILSGWIFLSDKFYPGISIAQVDIKFLNQQEAQTKISDVIINKLQQPLTITSPQPFLITLSDSVTLDAESALNNAEQYGHQRFYRKPVNVPLQVNFTSSFESQVQKIAQTVNQFPIDSSLKVEGDQITVTQSQAGTVLDEDKLKDEIAEYINSGVPLPSTLPLKVQQPKLTYDQALEIKKRLEEIRLSPLNLTFDSESFTLDLAQVLNLIDLQNTGSQVLKASFGDQEVTIPSIDVGGNEITDSKLTLNQQKVTDYLKGLSSQIDRPVQEPQFSVDPASDPKKPKITEFKPPINGQTLDIKKAAQRITDALVVENQKTVALPVNVTPPKNQLVNDLGIKELIGRGESNFAHSIDNRVFNVGLAASRLNGALVAPHETFSFNQTVGDISAATGYKQAYVIEAGKTVLGDGGGVCQVSTTLFRSVLNSGMPITDRTAHAYRVSYYEEGYPPGIDATTYYPTVDFKFLNDTDHYILIQAYVPYPLHLTVDLYGTSDGRVAKMSDPVFLSRSPALPDLRQDDPTLPKGTVKQVDFAAAGANIIFSRQVIKDGKQIINESFRSNYRPWQAIYLVGTKEG